MNRTRALRPVLTAAGVALAVMAIFGCGGSGGGTVTARSSTANEAGSDYVGVLTGIRDAAKSEGSYDGYGFAEYLPSTQRAAIDAFCFVADRAQNESTAEDLTGSALVDGITRKAESDLKSERNIVAPVPARRAIGKLRSVLGLESLDRDLAKQYVRACYR